MTATPRRAAIFGPEWWSTIAGASWSHFDRWFAIVGVVDFEGDLDDLEADLVGRLRSSLHSRGDMEAKLSHLADLRARVASAQIDALALNAADEPDKATVAKAHRKVLDQALEDRAMTPAMRDTPRARLNQRALYGHWDRFPVNPDRWYQKLAGRRPASHIPKGRTFALTRQLGERLDRLDGPRRAGADRLALYRAFHTVGVELAEHGDDSYGNIGDLRVDAFGTYLDIDWETSGMTPEHWWRWPSRRWQRAERSSPWRCSGPPTGPACIRATSATGASSSPASALARPHQGFGSSSSGDNRRASRERPFGDHASLTRARRAAAIASTLSLPAATPAAP